MNILEVEEGALITVSVRLGTESRDFHTTARQVLANTLLVDEIVNEQGEALSFATDAIGLEVFTMHQSGKPIIWRRVVIRHITYKGKNYHRIAQLEDGKVTNRRSCYRLSVGNGAVLSKGMGRAAIDVILRDVSVHGFSFVTPADLDVSPTSMVRLSCPLADYKDHNLQMMGRIVRKLQVAPDDPRYIYGCYVAAVDRDLDEWIIKKEREQLKNRSLNK